MSDIQVIVDKLVDHSAQSLSLILASHPPPGFNVNYFFERGGIAVLIIAAILRSELLLKIAGLVLTISAVAGVVLTTSVAFSGPDDELRLVVVPGALAGVAFVLAAILKCIREDRPRCESEGEGGDRTPTPGLPQ